MNETPFFFPNGSYNLFGILHEPEGESKGEGFVFCHPFAEEKLWSHRVFVNFARELAKIGYTVLRFDYMGHGDSEGKFEESSIETRLSDIKCAIQLLRGKMNGLNKINLLGLRFGATLAALVSEKAENIDKLILWDPIVNGSTYMKQMLRINISTQSAVYKEVRYNTDALIQQMKDGSTVNIDGYEISWNFFDQAQKIDLLEQKKVFAGVSLIVQISKKNGKISNSFTDLSKTYAGCDLTLAIEEPFWREIRSYYYRANSLFLTTRRLVESNMNVQIKPVTFLNRNGLKLFGILHLPKNEYKDIGIIILSPGIKSRIAPHRLYIKMAERLCDMGFPVFRFDPEGLGDSEGEITEHNAADVYGSIQIGRFVDDTIAAMDWMESEGYASRFNLTGLCGGAITGLLAGSIDSRIDSLISLGIPVILDSKNIDKSKYITEGQLIGMRGKYIRKVIDLKAWVRFFSFKSEYKIMFKALVQPLKKYFMNSGSAIGKGLELNHSKLINTNLNPYFPRAFSAMASKRKMLLIFSGADRLYYEFEEKYMRLYKNEYEKSRSNVQIEIVPDANHIFSFYEWQNVMLNISCAWLNKQKSES